MLDKLFSSRYFAQLFITCGIIIQIISAWINSETALSLLSGISGIIAVVLCSQKNFKFYLFAWIQTITYFYIAMHQNLYGEMIEYVFYAITMIYGMWAWLTNYNHKTEEVATRGQSIVSSVSTAGLTFVGIMVVYSMLKTTNDTQPFLDSLSTVPAFVAQILMVARFKEQWFYWLVIDIASIVMWLNAGDYCMVSQFIFWTLNCLYGYYMWNKTNNVLEK